MKITAEFVEFMDNLLDNVNGCPGGAQKGKLRKAVKKYSGHFKFWRQAINKIKRIKFIDRSSKIAKQRRLGNVSVPFL